MIELNSQDIINLYGRYLFVIPNEERQESEQLEVEELAVEEILEAPATEASPEPESVSEPVPASIPELTSGTPVVWKMKAQSRIAMVLNEAAFKNRAMTIILKDCVERAGMSTALIGFGILKTGESTFDFSEQPVPFALVFSPEISEKEVVQLPGGNEVYPQPSLADIIMNQDKQEALISLLQQLNQRL